MKKSLLVISVILLIAGLFISCNSEAAETSSEVGYVKFGGSDDAKALAASVDPEDAPVVSSLYWYYRAIKNGNGFTIGQKTVWTRINNGTGLAGTIGPFSKGSWYFELVGSVSETEPSEDDVKYIPAQDTTPASWTIDDNNVKYYGVSGTGSEIDRTAIALTSGTTTIPVSLKSRSTSTTAKVIFDAVKVLESTDTMTIPAGSTVYLTVKFGDTTLSSSLFASNTAQGDITYGDTTTGLTIEKVDLGTRTLTIEVYEDSDRTNMVQSGSVGFTAAAGDTITITGSIGSLDACYAEFGDSDAYVLRNSERIGSYDTFDHAVEAANTANDTVVLLRDVTFGTDRIVLVWEADFDLDLNGKTFTTNSNQSITASNNGYKASAICYGNGTSSARSVTVKNGTIRTAYGAGIYADGSDLTLTIENVDISQNYPSNVQTTDEYSSAVRLTSEATVIIESGLFYGKNAVAVSNSGGTVIINGGTFNSPLFFSSGTDQGVAKSITINGGTFNNFSVTNLAKGTLVIKGGTFQVESMDAYSSNIAPNYEAHDNGNGTWTVQPQGN